MTFRRPGERSRMIARIVVVALCVSAPFSGSVWAQSSQKTQFRDARLLGVLADDEQNAPAANSNVVSANHKEAKNADKTAKIRRTSADSRKNATASAPKTTRSKTRAIAQAQYAASPISDATAQGINDNLNATDGPFEDVCPDPRDLLSPIEDIPYKVFIPTTDVPESCPLPDELFQRKAPTPITFTWKASSLCYKPLYFEEVQLERYGHYCSPWLQPVLSRACFLVKIPALPYLMGVDPPNQCVYDLGYYRPGACAPSMIEPVPISLRGGLLEAGAIVGAAAVIP